MRWSGSSQEQFTALVYRTSFLSLKMRGYLHRLTPKISVHAIASACLLKGRKSGLRMLLSSPLIRSKKLGKYDAGKMTISLQIPRGLKTIRSLVSRRKR